MDLIWILTQINQLLKNYDIYEAIGNWNTDWIVYDINEFLLMLRCDYCFVVIF